MVIIVAAEAPLLALMNSSEDDEKLESPGFPIAPECGMFSKNQSFAVLPTSSCQL